MINIYVGNLSFRTTEEELKGLFAQFGAIDTVSIIKERGSGRSKGFGFVEMPNAEEAKKAIEALNEKEFGGRNLRINEAKPKEDRPSRRNFADRS